MYSVTNSTDGLRLIPPLSISGVTISICLSWTELLSCLGQQEGQREAENGEKTDVFTGVLE